MQQFIQSVLTGWNFLCDIMLGGHFRVLLNLEFLVLFKEVDNPLSTLSQYMTPLDVEIKHGNVRVLRSVEERALIILKLRHIRYVHERMRRTSNRRIERVHHCSVSTGCCWSHDVYCFNHVRSNRERKRIAVSKNINFISSFMFFI